MSRNDIRLRRKRMTSRGMKRHKNYRGLMKKHRRSAMAKNILKWVVVALIAIVLFYLIGFLAG